jgi:alkanesulfonate monooxygenase SsuD/methylene tetrahydromethanopterin reductase-like flavin-dependent oxidoreductase (luciferase family)
MYCAETEEEAEEGWTYFHNQQTAAQHHYFEWNNPGLTKIKGYEEYENLHSADAPLADSLTAGTKRTQPIGTPAQVLERIKAIQQAISMGKLVIHFFYGGMEPEKAEKSLRLFAKEVLPELQAMDTPLNPEHDFSDRIATTS